MAWIQDGRQPQFKDLQPGTIFTICRGEGVEHPDGFWIRAQDPPGGLKLSEAGWNAVRLTDGYRARLNDDMDVEGFPGAMVVIR